MLDHKINLVYKRISATANSGLSNCRLVTYVK